MGKLGWSSADIILSGGYCWEMFPLLVTFSPCVVDRSFEHFYSNCLSIDVCV